MIICMAYRNTKIPRPEERAIKMEVDEYPSGALCLAGNWLTNKKISTIDPKVGEPLNRL